MKLGDQSQRNGRDRNCGRDCTRHKLTVTSDIDQDVWVGAHTYKYYSYADGEDCPSHTGDYLLSQLGKTKSDNDKRKNMIFDNKRRTARSWEAGDIWLPKMFLLAGESVEIEVELNLERKGVSKDWSVTAWGEQGGVTVTHNDGLASDSLPYQPKGGSFAIASTSTVQPKTKSAAASIPTLEIPEIYSSFELDIPEISSNTPTLEVPEISSSTKKAEGFKVEFPLFEMPVFEMETEPQESAFQYKPEPVPEPKPEPIPEPK